TLLYSYVPTDVPSSAYTWSNANNQITDSSVRFWKEYIDFVSGVWHDPTGNIQTPGNPSCSYGTDFTPGTSTGGSGISISGPDATIYINGLVDPGFTISNQGSGYTSAPTVNFDNTGTNGSGAAATAKITSGKVTGITLTNPGSGYTKAPL